MKKKVVKTQDTPEGSILYFEDGSQELMEGVHVKMLDSRSDEPEQVDNYDEESLETMAKKRRR